MTSTLQPQIFLVLTLKNDIIVIINKFLLIELLDQESKTPFQGHGSDLIDKKGHEHDLLVLFSIIT